MKRLSLAVAVVVSLAVPAAASAAPSGKDFASAARACAEQRDGAPEAFEFRFRSFGSCVMQGARDERDERRDAAATAARDCVDERGDTPESRAAFREQYGNERRRHAMRRCLREKAEAEKADEDADDRAEWEVYVQAFGECATERGETDESRAAFQTRYAPEDGARRAMRHCVGSRIGPPVDL